MFLPFRDERRSDARGKVSDATGGAMGAVNNQPVDGTGAAIAYDGVWSAVSSPPKRRLAGDGAVTEKSGDPACSPDASRC